MAKIDAVRLGVPGAVVDLDALEAEAIGLISGEGRLAIGRCFLSSLRFLPAQKSQLQQFSISRLIRAHHFPSQRICDLTRALAILADSAMRRLSAFANADSRRSRGAPDILRP
jgi:hypothetical protein